MILELIDHLFLHSFKLYKKHFLKDYNEETVQEQRIAPVLGEVLPYFSKTFMGTHLDLKSMEKNKSNELKQMPPTDIVYETPKTLRRTVGAHSQIVVELPGIDSLNNIIFTQFAQSVEIRAHNRETNKAYFTIVQKPAMATENTFSKFFENDKLVLSWE